MQRILFKYVILSSNYRTPTTAHTCLTKCELASFSTLRKCANLKQLSAKSLDKVFTNSMENGNSLRQYRVTKTSSHAQTPGKGVSSSLEIKADDLDINAKLAIEK